MLRDVWIKHLRHYHKVSGASGHCDHESANYCHEVTGLAPVFAHCIVKIFFGPDKSQN